MDEARVGVGVNQATTKMSALQRMGAWRASSGGSIQIPRPAWLQRVLAGNQFNQLRRTSYPYNEVRINTDDGYVVLDSYNPAFGEIVSRKFTQFSEIQEQTGIGYVDELASKYSAGSPIANVPSTGILAGNKLSGNLILEVPPQIRPIPQAVLDRAAESGVTIRDTNGSVY